MKEIVDHLHENRQIKLAKEILESHGYKVSKKIKESTKYNWEINDDNGPETLYYLADYDDDGEGALPYITFEDGVYIAMLGGNDYHGKKFPSLEKAEEYILSKVDPKSFEKYKVE